MGGGDINEVKQRRLLIYLIFLHLYFRKALPRDISSLFQPECITRHDNLRSRQPPSALCWTQILLEPGHRGREAAPGGLSVPEEQEPRPASGGCHGGVV